MNTMTHDQISPRNSGEESFAFDVSDDSLERAADPERLRPATLAFCSGLDTCPS